MPRATAIFFLVTSATSLTAVFLLKFARDRSRYLGWVFETKKRLGLSVFDYMATSNQVYRMVIDT